MSYGLFLVGFIHVRLDNIETNRPKEASSITTVDGPLPCDSGCPASCALLARWFDQGLKKHKRCHVEEEDHSWLPTRPVDFGDVELLYRTPANNLSRGNHCVGARSVSHTQPQVGITINAKTGDDKYGFEKAVHRTINPSADIPGGDSRRPLTVHSIQLDRFFLYYAER